MTEILLSLLPFGIGLLIFVAVMGGLMLFSNQGEKLLDTLSGNYIEKLKPLFARLNLRVAPAQFVMIQLGLALVLFTVGLATGPDVLTKLNMGVLLGLIGFWLPQRWLREQEKRRAARFRDQFADAAALIGNSVRSGLSLLQAMEVLVREMEDPMAYEVYQVLQQTRVGMPLDTALEQWAERMQNPDLDIFVTAVTIQRQTGGDLGHVLNTLAGTVRQRQRIHGQIQSLTAQGRLGAIVLCGLPIFMGVALYFINPKRMGLMFSEPLGWGMLLLSAVTISAGYVLVRKIVDIDI
ncbi:MAG TPA: type II secretion system F family protein [Candidatus Obscuribacterales bacterium]